MDVIDDELLDDNPLYCQVLAHYLEAIEALDASPTPENSVAESGEPIAETDSEVDDADAVADEISADGDKPDSGPRYAERVRLDEIDPEELTAIHGQLIAFGYLKFQVDRTGLGYRVSKEGRQFLKANQELVVG